MMRSNKIKRHIFVLDTNVLLFDPNALRVFDEHDLMIPITVIEEIDNFKKHLNEVGRNARMVSRQLDDLRKEDSLAEGVHLGTGGRLWVQLPEGDTELPPGLKGQLNDNLILNMTLRLARQHPPGKVILVTRDTNMRIKADALGIPAEDYANAHVEMDEFYSGIVELDTSAETVALAYSQGWLELPEEHSFYPNQFVIYRNEQNPKQQARMRYHADQSRLILVKAQKEGVWGVQARNMEQLFALELLLDKSISCVTLTGLAGTGKTLMAIGGWIEACG